MMKLAERWQKIVNPNSKYANVENKACFLSLFIEKNKFLFGYPVLRFVHHC